MLSYYQILQLEETASDAEIKQAYRRLGKILHPDVNGNTTEATTMFRLLNQAYETLSDPLKRKAYDIDPDPTESDNSRIESYKKQNAKQSSKLKEYDDKLKEYKETVYLKSKRERELVNEVSELKKRNLESESELSEMKNASGESGGQSDLPQNQTRMKLVWIILLIIGVNVLTFLSYFAIDKVFGGFF